MNEVEKTPALAEERTLEARLGTHADIADLLTQLQAAVGEEAVPDALRLALELAKNGVQEADVVPMLRASQVDGFMDVTLQDAVEVAKLRTATYTSPSVLTLRLRKIAATLTGPADVQTLLYAADRLSRPTAFTVGDAATEPEGSKALAVDGRSLEQIEASAREAYCTDVPPLAAAVRRLTEAFIDAAERADWAEQHPRDEYHTMEELYEYRMLYNALAFNAWAHAGTYPVVKSWRHSDGELCFGGGWFIVTATLPTGLVSNHYRAEHWDLFQLPEGTPPEYDGHTPAIAADRMRQLLTDGQVS